MNELIGVALNESDRRLLIILLIVILLLFLLLGFIGMLIRAVSIRFSRRMDYEIHDVVIYRVVQSPEALAKYGRAKNRRLFFRQTIPPFLIALGSLVFYLVNAGITKNWNEDFWGEFGLLFYHHDWSNPDNYANVFGITLLAKWPDILSSPTLNAEYYAAYILVPLWITSIAYFLINVQAYMCRAYMLNKRTHTVFEKSLDDFNFFDDVKAGSVPPPPPGGGPTPS